MMAKKIQTLLQLGGKQAFRSVSLLAIQSLLLMEIQSKVGEVQGTSNIQDKAT
jgi:hypothetical protein